MSKVVVGIVTKPQGLKGEFRAVPKNVSMFELENQKKLYINGTMLNVEKCVNRNTFLVFKVKEFTNINEIEKVKNCEIEADDITLKPKNELEQCIGFNVLLSDSTKVGTLVEINNYGSTDVLTIQTNQKQILVALVDGLIESSDNDTNTLVFDKIKYSQVCVD